MRTDLNIGIQGTSIVSASTAIDLFAVAAPEVRDFQAPDTRANAPSQVSSACLHHLIEAQAQRTPNDPAVACEGVKLTYEELCLHANSLAFRLQEMGAGPGVTIALFLERSASAVAAMLGILKAGAAYVPIDSTFPAGRIGFILENAAIRIVVTERHLLEKLPAAGLQSICVDEFDWTYGRQCRSLALAGQPSDTLAYVIYTSGSTGRPKGVAIEHRSIVNYVLGVTERLRFEPGMNHAMVSTFAADLGNTVLFPALVTGGCLHIISHERARSQSELSDYFDREKIDVLKIVPSHLAALQAGKHPEKVMPRRRLILGGEASRIEFIRELRAMAPGCEIYNHYGPTETTVGVLTYRVGKELPVTATGNLPLGTPLPNSNVYLLDEHGDPVPPGTEGEIYISGLGVARGYLHQPELTAGRFLLDRFSGSPGGRMYRTGDLARCLPDGNLEFCGRIDDQVKIHGYRIELGEIECALREQPGVKDALVLALDGASGTRELVAYVVPKRQNQPLWASKNVHLLPGGLQVAQLNRAETDAAYKQIFVEKAYLQHGIRIVDGDCIVDLGASIGLFAIFASRLAANLRVICLEADPAAYAYLKLNTEVLGDGVECPSFDAAQESAEEEFFAALSGGGSSEDRRTGNHAGGSSNLREVMVRDDLERVALLRVRGTAPELEALRQLSSREWEKIAQVVVDLRSHEDVETTAALLRQQGFEVIEEPGNSLDSAAPSYVYGLRSSDSPKQDTEHSHGNANSNEPRNAGQQLLSPLLLRSALQERLLQQMVPAAFVLLSEFPLTANGKIDRHALSALTPEAAQNSREFVAPRNRTEKLLAEIWSELLKVENAGIHDDFFDLGGHSLLAIRAVSRIKDALGADLPLAALLHAPTIAQLAEMLRNQQYTPSWKSLVPLRASGSRPPLFFVHAHGGNVLEYNALARLLDADQPVYGIQASGLDGNIRPELTIEQMASEYLAEIRTLQPQGPYFLAGFCFGGPVALEIAQQIRQAGEEVGLLVLIQSTHPAVFHLFKPGISAPRRWWYRLQKQFDLERENTLHAGSTYLWRRARYVGDLLLARLAVAFGSRLEKQPSKSANLPKLFIFERLKREHLSALANYRPRQYDGKAILFRASKQMRGLLADETLGWSDTLLGPCEVCEVPGHQQNLMLEPNVQRVARELEQRLRATLRQYRYSKG